MSDYAQTPLASTYKATRLSDMESNLLGAVSIIGGSGYSGGVSAGPFTGAIGASRINDAPWISNARKKYPYSYNVYVAHLASSVTGDVKFSVGGIDLINSPSDVLISFAYGSVVSGGPTMTGSVSLSCATTSLSFSSLAALTTAYTSSPLTFAASTDPNVGAIAGVLSISTVGASIRDAMVIIAIKSQHIA